MNVVIINNNDARKNQPVASKSSAWSAFIHDSDIYSETSGPLLQKKKKNIVSKGDNTASIQARETTASALKHQCLTSPFLCLFYLPALA